MFSCGCFQQTEKGFLWENFSILGKEKSHTGQDLVSTERVRVLIFVFQLNWRILWDHFGTYYFHLSVITICLTYSLCIFSSSVIVLMPKRRTALIRVLIFSTFSADFIVNDGQVVRHLPHPFILLKKSSATQTHGLLIMVFSSYTSRNKLNVSVVVFSSFTRNFMLTRCPVFYKKNYCRAIRQRSGTWFGTLLEEGSTVANLYLLWWSTVKVRNCARSLVM
jgi:hypothetical protein